MPVPSAHPIPPSSNRQLAIGNRQFPILLHHGFFSIGDLKLGPIRLRYFHGIDRAIADRGHAVVVTNVHPTSSVENRARQLKENILKQSAILGRRQRFIILAHSMGGLDARYAVARLGLASRVAAVVTVTCPHRGSPFADWAMHHLGRRLRGIQLVNSLGLDFRAVLDLTTDRCAAFNDQIPDVPGVEYFSVSAARPRSHIPPFALPSHKIIHAAEGDNDGLVSVKSSTWGTHLGVWPADHWLTINRRYIPKRNDPTSDIIPFWMRMLDQVTAALDAKINSDAHV